MAKIGRNDLCSCGSGRKYKKCCEAKEQGKHSRVMLFAVGGAVLVAILAGIVSFTSRGAGAPGSVRIWSPEHGHYHNENGVQVP